MTAPPSARPRPPLRPLQGSEWFAARLALAIRRTQKFTKWWAILGGTAAGIALLLPVAAGGPVESGAGEVETAVADTVRTASARDVAIAIFSASDTALQEARTQRPRPAPPRPASASDPRLPSLEAAIARARSERSLEALLALADEPAVRYGPRMQATADSLRTTVGDEETRRLTNTILGIAQFRRNAIASADAPVTPVVAAPPATVDTTALAERVSAWQDSVARATAAHTAALDALAGARAAAAIGRAPVPPVSPGLALLALVIAGLVLRIGIALVREIQQPRLAVPQEAEHAVGAPVLAHVRDAIPDGPLRFRPTGVDPFRVLYLGLTSTGTRTRSLIVTGADPVIVAAVGARLAIAAAADHRTTLVGELDSEQVALARVFRDHPEPGFTDALSGSFKWREVARSVGSSDGLLITMIPAGTTRDVAAEESAREEAHSTFTTFRNGFEFTILAVGLSQLEDAKRLLGNAPIVLCGTLGETTVEGFTADGAAVQQGDQRIHSLVLWDAPRPSLPSRAELAAYLSKRKGRTPGGSFKAVQEATKKPV